MKAAYFRPGLIMFLFLFDSDTFDIEYGLCILRIPEGGFDVSRALSSGLQPDQGRERNHYFVSEFPKVN